MKKLLQICTCNFVTGAGESGAFPVLHKLTKKLLQICTCNFVTGAGEPGHLRVTQTNEKL